MWGIEAAATPRSDADETEHRGLARPSSGACRVRCALRPDLRPDEPVAELIPAMLAAFLDSDRAFAKIRTRS